MLADYHKLHRYEQLIFQDLVRYQLLWTSLTPSHSHRSSTVLLTTTLAIQITACLMHFCQRINRIMQPPLPWSLVHQPDLRNHRIKHPFITSCDSMWRTCATAKIADKRSTKAVRWKLKGKRWKYQEAAVFSLFLSFVVLFAT